MQIREGDRVWVETPTGQPAAPGWENGHAGHAIKIHSEGLIPLINVRDSAGREIQGHGKRSLERDKKSRLASIRETLRRNGRAPMLSQE
jgi:hypothetical protein